MGKKKDGGNIGRSLIKDRFKGKKVHRNDESHLHTSELNDGYDWNRLNLQSVTEQNTLDEFLATAELAGTEFQAEKLNITFIKPEKYTGLLTKEEEKNVKAAQEKHKYLLSIPRRPAWDKNTTAEELDRKERDNFLEWRRNLAELQEVDGLILTPFERNLDFWRQLWRVIERSDIVVQIVDARNPLLFRCEDLELYVKEIDNKKCNVLLINKADHLTLKQRELWAKYFDRIGVKIAFWSAMKETEENKLKLKEKEHQTEEDAEANPEDSNENDSEMEDEDMEDELEKLTDARNNDLKLHDSRDEKEQHADNENKVAKDMELVDSECVHNNGAVECTTGNAFSHTDRDMDTNTGDEHVNPCQYGDNDMCSHIGNKADLVDVSKTQNTGVDIDSSGASCSTHEQSNWSNSSDVLNGDELIEFLKSQHVGEKYLDGVTTIGLVGYPNVGKSSTINAILQTKKVPVSATPGRTKHFQTLYIDKTVMLCDCPGLVMPTFVSTKAEMIVCGILPIDQMRDFVPPVSLICKHIPRKILEATYGILLPKPKVEDGEDPDRLPTAHELLTAYSCMRGFMTHKGVPDFQRSARVILKDYVNGKLLFCHPSPNSTVEHFRPVGEPQKPVKPSKDAETSVGTAVLPPSSVDKDFFSTAFTKANSKGKHGVEGFSRKSGFTEHHCTGTDSSHSSQQSLNAKPWRKHGNKNKKEKLRRKHKDLDMHTN